MLIQIFFRTSASTFDLELSTVIPNSAPPSSKSQTLLVEISGSNMYLSSGIVVVGAVSQIAVSAFES